MHNRSVSPISNQKFHLLIFMLERGIITFKQQQIYSNNRAFKRAMKEMHDKGLVLARKMNGQCNEYKLSDKGYYFAFILNEMS